MASNLVKTLIRSPNRTVSSPLSSVHKLRFMSDMVNSEVTVSHTAKWMQGVFGLLRRMGMKCKSVSHVMTGLLGLIVPRTEKARSAVKVPHTSGARSFDRLRRDYAEQHGGNRDDGKAPTDDDDDDSEGSERTESDDDERDMSMPYNVVSRGGPIIRG
ncbi:hypothetical protein AgCh_028326 [Apium graveolens]